MQTSTDSRRNKCNALDSMHLELVLVRKLWSDHVWPRLAMSCDSPLGRMSCVSTTSAVGSKACEVSVHRSGATHSWRVDLGSGQGHSEILERSSEGSLCLSPMLFDLRFW